MKRSEAIMATNLAQRCAFVPDVLMSEQNNKIFPFDKLSLRSSAVMKSIIVV